MADVNTSDAEQAKVEASFGEGFGTPPVEPAKVVEEAKAEPTAEIPVPVAAPEPVPEKPKYARIPLQEYNDLKAGLKKVTSLEGQIARVVGTMGNAQQIAQDIVEKVRAQTPAGLSVELSDEDFAELAADFPELAKHTRAALEKVFKKAGVRGTGPVETPQLRGEDVDRAVETALQKREAAALVKAYPEWSAIVGQVDVSKGQKPDEKNEFRQWLGRQSAEYQKEINETDSPAEVRSAIDKFMASKSAPATQATPNRAAARRAIMEAAETPRVDGSPPLMNPPPNVDDAFASGFRQARR